MRCSWATGNELLIAYHDEEWGVPKKDEEILFEMLSLEIMQAGLKWEVILKKRDGFKAAFHNFKIQKVAEMTEEDIQQLMANKEIIRNQRKIRAIIKNAQTLLRLKEEGFDFGQYLWSFVGDKQIVNHWEFGEQVPAQTALSQKIAKDMKKRGFAFIGPTIIYSFMQAIGMVDDHLINCEIKKDNGQ
ncbi:DNA-3-methyladenine glycosylase I [Liquorilactobacillus mali]|uniref:DNA-3-methyladenine glycosylase I n=1 Tax=Liquorilactobacillus mali KCTC 3596 = DSM 20444 TaxID=1046596 RepID=J0KZJ6_9LACO|nr:DNA-3-methyladenine glycosylase I [Liquorilactobacillus mali]EJF00071.1 DNA-3-methyladenine glycosylase I [Liquorilactobacillus mali KCTC 3596 = DSM 20444]KRN09029.1 DNA-3-methyladenine glycosylase I [Liquorilactobacillus mali KCTC 3596 = DSM 20444]MDC7953556.1 DNA-3-methyladenine glycosylase I [Liquorilactobacillus mali]MDV7758311.1 DNA-3-methyladenine glycosylase I [Liquorilactobacillus mali]QFQ74483.1 DNA-3-methyladenine glycosylase I [Liquorilactobacillus mali]